MKRQEKQHQPTSQLVLSYIAESFFVCLIAHTGTLRSAEIMLKL